MRKIAFVSLVIMMSLSTTLYAGGKGISLVDTPIEPIPPLVQPTPVYIGLGLIWARYHGCATSPGCIYEDVTYGAMLRAGYEWNEYFGVEARLLGSIWAADSLGGQKLQHLGLFAKPMYPLGEDFNAYALLGYGWTQTSTGGNGNLPTIDEGGFSAGLGLEYDLSDKEDDREDNGDYDREFDGQADEEKGWGLFVDYQRLLIKTDIPDMDVVSTGVTYDF